MKLIIDIPKGEYDKICTTMMHTSSGNPNFYFESKIANGIPIPDNATNGDMIKTVFNVNVEDDFCQSIGIKLNDSNYVQFNKGWWNAPYQKGGKE